MAKIECPKCKRKSLRYRESNKDYICDHVDCEAIFNKDLKEMHVKGKNMFKDKCGNYYTVKIEKTKDIIKHTEIFYLEPNKTTLRGEYEKLRDNSNCKYPERLMCNIGISCDRCEYMKYGGTVGYWKCIYEKEVKN